MVLAARLALPLLVGLAIHMGTVAEAALTYSSRSAVTASDQTLRAQDVVVPVSGRSTRGPGGYRGGSSSRPSPGRSYSKAAKPRRSSPKQSTMRSQKNGPAAQSTSGIAARRSTKTDPRTFRLRTKLSTQSGRISGRTRPQVTAQRSRSRAGLIGNRSQSRNLSRSKKSESLSRIAGSSKGRGGARGIYQKPDPVKPLQVQQNRHSIGVRIAREKKGRNSNSRFTLMATSPRALIGRYSGHHPYGLRAALGVNASRMGREVVVARAKQRLNRTLAQNKLLTANQNIKTGRFGHVFEKHFKDVLNHAKAYSGKKVVIGKDGLDPWMQRYGYRRAGIETGTKYFDPPATNGKKPLENELSPENKKFLSDAVKEGARVYLATPHQFRSRFYQLEIEHLEGLGYVISRDGLYMHSP